ncbi:ATP-binding protein [Saccharothrix deserti]|uniref:ATP-binding protein n=1 Tax=Saccharothrix deserti TaxID=2593674 RepID=UPI00131CE61D|nr:ATP-binding protein [Saccharothrix deserti]
MSEEPDPRGVSCDLDTAPAREVRRMAREVLAGHGGIVVDDAVLVVDELVGNARRHGTGPRVCWFGLIDQGRRLRVEVDDTSPRRPHLRTPDASGGRGLLVVDRLASAWGVQRHIGHKTVWAELALDRAASSARAPHLAAAPDWRHRT